MEENKNEGDSNTIKDSTKAQVNMIPSNTLPKKRRIQLLIIGFIILILLLGSTIFILINRQKVSYQQLKENTKAVSGSTASPSDSKTVRLQSTNILDDNTELIFGNGKGVYAVKNDGVVKKLSTTDQNVAFLRTLPNGNDMYVQTTLVKKGKIISEDIKEYFLNLEAIPSLKESTSNQRDSSIRGYQIDSLANFAIVQAKQTSNGESDLLLDIQNGTQPTKIGHVADGPLRIKVCEGGGCGFIGPPRLYGTSPNGSFLLNAFHSGGGVGEPGVVLSRDGSKIYNIDFYWYASSAVWISDNKLLTKDDKDSKIITLNSDGTSSTQKINPIVADGYFTQKYVSPDFKTLAVLGYNPSQIYLYDIVAQTKKAVSLPEGGDSNSMRIIGWNKKSSQLLVTMGNKVWIINAASGTSKQVATVTPPSWVYTNGYIFAQNVIDIR